MFEGSDLSVAYGFDQSMDGSGNMMGGGGMYGSQMMQQQPQQQAPSYPPPPVVQQVGTKPQMKQMVSVQQPGDLPYQPQEAMYAHTKPVPQGDSFFERVAAKRYEVSKVIAFAFIILFAISMDRLLTFYLSQYISQSILTTTQELLVRASYPVAILLVIWFIKAM